MKTRALEQLPDLPVLLQLRDSLYGKSGGRRAAVLVGSGYSRNARLAAGDGRLPPLWADFEQEMSSRLHITSPVGPQNVLRLAEEFVVNYGRAALDDLVRHLVRDDSWEPSEAHDRLLSLPWTDVLTTNWDTLLERSAQRSLRRRYAVVRTVGDMARAKAPRIVKLHGSMPSQTPFVFTEEDYRRYPNTHAPYVNFARQVFIENELVLIGFSGDDPNFLQWAGWVRDQLGDQSRRLYIVGVLSLAASRRRLLESLNIAAVDLAPLVADVELARRHSDATQHLLDFLEAGRPRRPSEWPFAAASMSLSAEPTVESTKVLVANWTKGREAYPGWILCPFVIRNRLRYELADGLRRLDKTIASLSKGEQFSALREVAWLSLLIGYRLPASMAQEMLHAGEKGQDLDSAARQDLARAAGESARLAGIDSLLQASCSLLERLPCDGGAWAALMQALRHRDLLDLCSVEKLLGRLKGDDPVWLIRRAGLESSIGRIREAKECYRSALTALRERDHREPDSLWIESRLTWAEFFAKVAHHLGSAKDELLGGALWKDHPNRDPDLDPWREIEHLRRELADEERERSAAVAQDNPRFDAGVYSSRLEDRGSRHPGLYRSPDLIRFVLDGFGSNGGVANVSFLREEARRAAALADQDEAGANDWAVSLADADHKSALINALFRRSSIAVMPIARVQALTLRMRAAIDLALERFGATPNQGGNEHEARAFWSDQLKAAMEILSRLSLRSYGEAAAELHGSALGWARRPAVSHYWSHERYSNLLNRTWDAIPKSQRTGLALAHLTFPMACEIHGDNDVPYWPDPLDPNTAYVAPHELGAWQRRLRELLELSASNVDRSRSQALLRLVHLHLAGALRPDESREVGNALWSVRREDGLPRASQLLDYVVYEVPAPPTIDPGALFWQKYFSGVGLFQPRSEWMQVVSGGALQAVKRGTATPSLSTAVGWATQLFAWRPPEPSHPVLFDFGERAAKASPRFLANAVFPFVGQAELIELWPAFKEFTEAIPEAISALPLIAAASPAQAAEGLSIVRRSLWHAERSRAIAGARAVHCWLGITPATLPWETLTDDVIALCTVPRHPAAVFVWNVLPTLVSKGFVREHAVSQVVQALEVLEPQTDYASWSGIDGRWEEEAPLVIVDAVRTARALRAQGVDGPCLQKWLNRPDTDPLPEVRRLADEVG